MCFFILLFNKRWLMNENIINHNASVIYNNPNSILVADKHGKLESISKFNLFGRVIEWIKDKKSGGERSRRTAEAINNTLGKIRDNLASEGAESFYFPDVKSSKFYKFNRPVDKLSDKILKSPLGSKKDISEVANEIKQLAAPMMQKLTEAQRHDLFNNPL